MRTSLWLLVLTLLATSTHAQSSADTAQRPLLVTHKLPDFGDLKRKTYEARVIQLALEKTQQKVGAFEMVPVNIISRTHAVAALEQNLYDNFVIALSYEDALLKSGKLAYIPFPIELGALSYRVCYTNQKHIAKVQQIKSVNELKPYKIGVGIGWVDGKILQHHGLTIIEGSNITSLFRMTQAGRVDVFCPGAAEYFHELAVEQETDLQLENKLALYYPLPKFLFSHKRNQALLERIQKGIELAYQDGSFLQLWNEVHAEDLKRAKFPERHIIHLENPFITTLKEDYKQYLFNPLKN